MHNKSFDGNISAKQNNPPSLIGIINDDSVSIVTGTIEFINKNAGTTGVAAAGYGISGTDAWKYNAPDCQPVFGSAVILPKNIKFDVRLVSDTSSPYTGQQIRPEIVVYDGNDLLIENVDYTVEYGENINTGTDAGSIIVLGRSNYEGSSGNISFDITETNNNANRPAPPPGEIPATNDGENNENNNDDASEIIITSTKPTPKKSFSELLDESIGISYGGSVNYDFADKNPTLKISKPDTEKIVRNSVTLILTQQNMTVTIPPELFADDKLYNAKILEVSVRPANDEIKNNFTDHIKGTSAGLNENLLRYVYDIKIFADGNAINSFSTPLKLEMSMTGLTVSRTQSRRLTFARFNENGLQYIGDKYDFYNKVIVSETTGLSVYGVVFAEDMTRLTMKVGDNKYTVGDVTKKNDAAPMIINGRTVVPARFFAEAFGASVKWDDDIKTASFTLDGRVFDITAGEKTPGIEAPAFIENGRIMVPFKYISEKLGINAIWDDALKIIRAYK